MLAAEERSVEIDRHHFAPEVVIGLLHSAERCNTGGVDQPIEPAGARLDRANNALPVCLQCHVERMIDAGPALEIARDGDAAIAHDRFRDRRANAARSAGDQNNLVAQATHARTPGVTRYANSNRAKIAMVATAFDYEFARVSVRHIGTFRRSGTYRMRSSVARSSCASAVGPILPPTLWSPRHRRR